MNNHTLFSLIMVLTLTLTCSGKVRQLSQNNLEQFSKDNSYWFIQITGRATSR